MVWRFGEFDEKSRVCAERRKNLLNKDRRGEWRKYLKNQEQSSDQLQATGLLHPSDLTSESPMFRKDSLIQRSEHDSWSKLRSIRKVAWQDIFHSNRRIGSPRLPWLPRFYAVAGDSVVCTKIMHVRARGIQSK